MTYYLSLKVLILFFQCHYPQLKLEKRTIILYEAPHKLKNTLETIKEVLGNRRIVLARELTKVYEEFIRKTVDEVLENIDEYRGEFVILIEGSSIGKKELELSNLNNMSIEEHYKYYEDQGLDKKEIIKQIAKDRNVPKNDIYQMFL